LTDLMDDEEGLLTMAYLVVVAGKLTDLMDGEEGLLTMACLVV
jgi:hypothetical protein